MDYVENNQLKALIDELNFVINVSMQVLLN